MPIPDDMPRRPPDALTASRKEHACTPRSEVDKMFGELEQEEKQRRQQVAHDALSKYEAELAVWESTEVGEKY